MRRSLAFSFFAVAALNSACSSSSSSSVDGGASGNLTAEQHAWLDAMNQARADVGEAPLGWDPLAAQVAQTYASMCNFAHNANRSTQYMMLGGKVSLGENISAGAPTQGPADAVSSWLAEKSSYDHATNTCASGQVCGHYTQIVWSTTTAVGCAHVSCTSNSPFGTGGSSPWDLSVCDFSPAGNIVGQPPY